MSCQQTGLILFWCTTTQQPLSVHRSCPNRLRRQTPLGPSWYYYPPLSSSFLFLLLSPLSCPRRLSLCCPLSLFALTETSPSVCTSFLSLAFRVNHLYALLRPCSSPYPDCPLLNPPDNDRIVLPGSLLPPVVRTWLFNSNSGHIFFSEILHLSIPIAYLSVIAFPALRICLSHATPTTCL